MAATSVAAPAPPDHLRNERREGPEGVAVGLELSGMLGAEPLCAGFSDGGHLIFEKLSHLFSFKYGPMVHQFLSDPRCVGLVASAGQCCEKVGHDTLLSTTLGGVTPVD